MSIIVINTKTNKVESIKKYAKRKGLDKKYKKMVSYNIKDPYDLPMILDNPQVLNTKGLKKRRGWLRRGLLK
jgi:hypothetical protein